MSLRSLGGSALVFSALLLGAAPSWADRVAGAAISVEASSADANVTMDLKWTAAEARSELTIYLHSALRVTSASVGGKPVQPSSGPVPDSRLTAWVLPAAVSAGETPVVLKAAVPGGDATDFQVGEDGGALYPGSGW
ncbi:MAG TPA: hypothetical protein VKU85_17285, partial [bacterium]|nr:hypothetical protein [bacterium]